MLSKHKINICRKANKTRRFKKKENNFQLLVTLLCPNRDISTKQRTTT